jgi:hypothetical protein
MNSTQFRFSLPIMNLIVKLKLRQLLALLRNKARVLMLSSHTSQSTSYCCATCPLSMTYTAVVTNSGLYHLQKTIWPSYPYMNLHICCLAIKQSIHCISVLTWQYNWFSYRKLTDWKTWESSLPQLTERLLAKSAVVRTGGLTIWVSEKVTACLSSWLDYCVDIRLSVWAFDLLRGCLLEWVTKCPNAWVTNPLVYGVTLWHFGLRRECLLDSSYFVMACCLTVWL